MIKARTIGTLAALASLALISTNALADGKSYPGVQCRQTSGGVLGFFGGTVNNLSSTTELNVICPFVKDSSSITNGTVTVYDRHPNLNVSCNIVTEFNNVNGNFFNFASVTSAGFGSAPQVLAFGAIPGNQYYYATCSVPRSSNGNVSHVASFDIVEP
jgi:hypothetical protein